ncbi:MAG: glycosyltransferase family 2 protein [Cumulibacter sp.]
MKGIMAPRVTVLIPVHNAAGLVADAVRSVLAEEVSAMEVLVVDDGSTDEGITELMALKDDRIRLLRQPQAGVVAALNRGLDAARGELVVRMDADDISVPGRIAAQMRWMQEHPEAVMCGTGYEMFGAINATVRMPVSDTSCRQRLLLSSCHCGASIMLRRSVLEDAGLRYDTGLSYAEDYEFITRVAGHGVIGNLPQVGYRYRIHDTQASLRHRDALREVHVQVAASYARRIRARPLPDEVVRNLLWPESCGVLGTAARTAWAAARAFARRPGVETARFCSRTLVENVLNAARSAP